MKAKSVGDQRRTRLSTPSTFSIAKSVTFIRKWRLKCRAVADSLEKAGDKLFTFTRFPKNQWKSIQTIALAA